MVSVKNGKKKDLRGHFGNYQINYLTQLDLNFDIVLIVSILCTKFFKRFMWEERRKE